MEKQVNSGVTYAQIDAFTDRMFGGNPAAICYLPEERTHEWMQLVAKDFNLSETAFLLKIPNTHSNNEFSLRWFTPKVEVDLCGHATLASAHFLFSQHGGLLDTKTIVFHTRSGILTAKRVGDGGRLIELDFPLIPISECDADDLELVKSALGSADIVWAGKPGGHGYLVEVSSTDELKSLKPDFQKMLVFGGRGDLIVTAAGGHDAQLDFTSRFFCPKAGILERPTHLNLLRATHSITITATPPSMSSRVSSVKSLLIEPDGGSLINLVVPKNERVSRDREASNLPHVKQTQIDLECAHVISEGWSSPWRVL
ncbi:hypothetical protein AMTR_s00086p00169110 [Amborella trichopoda]|uniref:Uncharacterized protein n=1 Tax=Amborella trichopoda TaxID=13333 RepID=W1P5C0_AMBTC|nr:hypothetical protein AMTR_s00086p00169110 [Amborella trichopoda]